MNEIGVFTPEQARLLWQDYQTRQSLSPQISKNLPLRRQIDEVSPHRVFIRNDSGEELPAYGCCQITGVAVVGGRTVVTVDKPSSTTSEYLFCSQFKIADGDVGWAYRFGVVVMLGDPPSSANQTYKPISGSWEIEEGTGPFIVYGEWDEAGTLLGRVAVTSTAPGGGASGACGCGTRYARGSQTITLNSVDYEAATTLTITPVCFSGTWPFPEATFDADHWETGAEVIEDCYTGDIQGEITIVPFVETIGTVGGTGYDTVQAWVILTNTANTCEDEDGNTSPDIEAKWLCREFRPLGPTCEAELIAGSTGNYALPKKLCISPAMNTVTCSATTVPTNIAVQRLPV